MLRIHVENALPVETSVHWHGIRLHNGSDGVPGLTQEPVAPAAGFIYEFLAPDPGTYFFHPHSGVQIDRGLYSPLIIGDPAEPGGYDHEWVPVLDDWTDHYLINGRIPRSPRTLTARPGQRARIRIINAAADTLFRVALGGHVMTVTHTDGFPVQPVETRALHLAQGERVDVLVTLGDGVFPLVAAAEGKGGQGVALVAPDPVPRLRPPSARKSWTPTRC